MKSFSRYKLLTICIIALTSLLSFDRPSDRYFDISKNMEIFTSVYSEVNRYYVDDVDPNDLMKKGIDAMLESLDPYTNYIPEDKIEDFRFISTGQYGGIGSMIGNRDNRILILMPYEGFPASKAGLKIGDEIIEIDGTKVNGKNTNDISTLLKGQADTEVSIKIKRYGTEEPIPVKLTREKITVNSVPYYGMITDDIGYFQLTTFTSDASKEIENALVELKKQGAKKFMFDLRGNTGGLLVEAINIANLFIDKGKEVVSTRGKVEKWNATHVAQNTPFDTEAPLVILTNNRSASASEIVSGVIQDYDRGILVGRQTYGKGLVQATMGTAFNSQLKVTTAKYYIPSGRCIQAIDYSNRDKEGKAKKIPDSLLVEYQTANGRKVFDGAGIAPDVIVELPNAPDILTALINKNAIFDYATVYAFEHDSIVAPKDFELTDEEYSQFVKWVKEKNIKLKIGMEYSVDELEKDIKADSSLNIDFKDEIVKMRQKLEEKKSNALMEEKKNISAYLESEICSRYYLKKGIIESSFASDPDIKEALSILNDAQKYQSILTEK